MCSEYRLACYDRLIRFSTIGIVDIENRECTFPEFVFSGRYPLPGFDIDDGVVWERDRCEAFPVESYAVLIESKVKVDKAVLLLLLGQVVGVVWHDMQEEASL